MGGSFYLWYICLKAIINPFRKRQGLKDQGYKQRTVGKCMCVGGELPLRNSSLLEDVAFWLGLRNQKNMAWGRECHVHSLIKDK